MSVSELKPNDVIVAYLGMGEVVTTNRVCSIKQEGPFTILRMVMLSRNDGKKVDVEVVRKPVRLDWQVDRLLEAKADSA